mgnify:CR=1 FL=1
MRGSGFGRWLRGPAPLDVSTGMWQCLAQYFPVEWGPGLMAADCGVKRGATTQQQAQHRGLRLPFGPCLMRPAPLPGRRRR